MSKRKIMAAAKRFGIEVTDVRYEWTPTPGESVPCYTIWFSEESVEKFGVYEEEDFANLQEVLDYLIEVGGAYMAVTGRQQ